MTVSTQLKSSVIGIGLLLNLLPLKTVNFSLEQVDPLVSLMILYSFLFKWICVLSPISNSSISSVMVYIWMCPQSLMCLEVGLVEGDWIMGVVQLVCSQEMRPGWKSHPLSHCFLVATTSSFSSSVLL